MSFIDDFFNGAKNIASGVANVGEGIGATAQAIGQEASQRLFGTSAANSNDGQQHNGVVPTIFRGAAQLANTGIAEGENIGQGASLIADKIFNPNDPDFSNKEAQAAQQIEARTNATSGGIFNAGTGFNVDKFGNNPEYALTHTVATGANVASEIAPELGDVRALGGVVQGGRVIPNVIRAAVPGAVIGAGGTVASDVQEGTPITAAGVLEGAASGAALGGVTQAGSEAWNALHPAATDLMNQADEALNREPGTQPVTASAPVAETPVTPETALPVKEPVAPVADTATVKPPIVPTEAQLEMAKAMGMNPDELQQVLTQTSAERVAGEAAPTAAEQRATLTDNKGNKLLNDGSEKYTAEEYADLQDRMDRFNAKNPQSSTLTSAVPGDFAQGQFNGDYLRTKYKQFADDVNKAAEGMSDNDKKALEDFQKGGSIDEVADRNKLDNPAQFKNVLSKMKDAYDFRQAHDADFARSGISANVPYRENYQPLMFDQTYADREGNLPPTSSQYKAGYSNTRDFPSYAESDAAGMPRKNANVIDDFNDAMTSAAGSHNRLATIKGLQEAFPGQVSVGQALRTPEGKPFIQLKNDPTVFAAPDVAKMVNARAIPDKTTNPLLKASEKGNAFLKYTELGGGLFHSVATAGRFGATQAARMVLHPTTIPDTIASSAKLIAGTLSKSAHLNNMAHFANDGSLGFAHRVGTTLNAKRILADADTGVIDKLRDSKLNFIAEGHDMVFDRQMPESKMIILRQNMENKFPDMDYNHPTAEQVDYGRQIASAANNLGGINRAADGLKPQTVKVLSHLLLAEDYTETKARLLIAAVSKQGPEGDIARQMVVGKAALFALPGIAAAMASGQIQNPAQFFETTGDQVLDPHIPTPWKTKSGIPEIAKLPSTEISELGKVLLPLITGSNGTSQSQRLSAAETYVTARAAPLPSTIWSLLTNKDYAGNPVVVRNADGSIDAGKTAEQLALSKAPVPVAQGVKVATGQEPLGAGVANEVGLKVGADPNSPQMKIINQMTALGNGLKGSAKVAWDAAHSKQTDQYGNPLTITVPTDTPDKASALLKDMLPTEQGGTGGTALAAMKKLNDFSVAQGKPSDPFYGLTTAQQEQVLRMRQLNGYDPLNATAAEMKVQNASWLKPYTDAETAYYNKLNLPPSTKTQLIPDVVASTATQAKLDNLSNMTGAAKAQYITNNPDISDYYSALDSRVRALRTNLQEPQYKGYPTATPALQDDLNQYDTMTKGPARTAFLKANPQIGTYFGQVATYATLQDAKRVQFEGEQPKSTDTALGGTAVAGTTDYSGASTTYGGSNKITIKAANFGTQKSVGLATQAATVTPKITIARRAITPITVTHGTLK